MADDELTSVLIVDDDPDHQRLLEKHLDGQGCRIEFASDGVEAMERLQRKPLAFDVVLLDRIMPRMDGMEVLVRIKKDRSLRHLPVIMQTGASTQEEILAGIRAGAYYYLTKPYDVETLVTMVTTAARDFGEYRRLRQEMKRGLECLTLVEHCTLVFRTVAQAKATASVLSHACPDPSAAVIGLTELLVNAVEHGNLGITYEEKTLLNSNGRWEEEIERRLAMPEYAGMRVELRMERTEEELRFIIRDEGPGFAWRRFLNVDPQRAFDNHGRGIAIAKAMSFDSIEYRGAGNEVVATVKLPGAERVGAAAAAG